MRRLAVPLVALILCGGALPSAAQEKPAAKDMARILNCLKAKPLAQDSCLGIVADPCQKSDATKSTADQNACNGREAAAWDSILNESYRKLRDKLDEAQQTKLRDMQRAWIASREKTCAFYWDYYQGTMASPMGSYCVAKETGRRALFLRAFVEEDK
ncbi:MAG TPA: lysozyme inhibitor LprI family protein [Pseudolabrys sp.]|nr:lysozyme inhibitor LprI family protein [Pseudolabrys sp.]